MTERPQYNEQEPSQKPHRGRMAPAAWVSTDVRLKTSSKTHTTYDIGGPKVRESYRWWSEGSPDSSNGTWPLALLEPLRPVPEQGYSLSQSQVTALSCHHCSHLLPAGRPPHRHCAGCACGRTARKKKGGVASAGVGSKARLRASSVRRSFSPLLSFLTRSPALLLSLLDAQSQRAHGSTQTPRHTISLLFLAHTHTVTGWHHRGSSEGRRTHTTHMTQCETPVLALKRTAFLLPCSPPLSPPPPLLKPSC